MTNIYSVKVNPNKSHLVDTGYTFSQGDFGITLAITVEELDTTGTTVKIGFRKKSGSVEATTLTVSGNTYSYVLRGTELDTPGEVIADLKFYNASSQRISTASFKFMVAEDVLAGLPEEAHSWSDSLAQMREKMVDEVLKDITTKPMKFRGGISSTGQLPMTGNANGDYYILTTNNHTYVWNGSAWTDIGVIVGVDQVATEALDIKMLGWSVPKECPVQNYMDSNRVFHQRVGRVDISQLDSLQYYTQFAYPRFEIAPPNMKIPTSAIESWNHIYCALYVKNMSAVSHTNEDKNMTGYTNDSHIYIHDFDCTSVNDYKSKRIGTYLYYELATEVTIPVDGNEMRKPFAWKFVGTAQYNGFVDMSSVSAYANEYIVVVTIDGSNTVFSGVLPMAEIPTNDTYKYIKTGAYRNASINADVTFGYSKNRVIANRVFIDGVENTNYSINVYYR